MHNNNVWIGIIASIVAITIKGMIHSAPYGGQNQQQQYQEQYRREVQKMYR